MAAFPASSRRQILRRGIVKDSVRLPHQAIVEFVAAVTRPIRSHVILKQADALREAEEFHPRSSVNWLVRILARPPDAAWRATSFRSNQPADVALGSDKTPSCWNRVALSA